MTSLTPAQIIERFGMQPHPEGGHYVETFRDNNSVGERPRSACTAIYFLLQAGERSAWHRVTDASEIWHWYAGGPLRLLISDDGGTTREITLGNDLGEGEQPQAVVEAGHWQSAEPIGDWTLVGCTVAPGFEFSSFEMAPPGWQPENSDSH